jgi:two-component system, chemotaxis family, CheB/CheR fusion protein
MASTGKYSRCIMAKENTSNEQDNAGTRVKNGDRKGPEGLPAEPDASPLAIVAIGASAGGLEAMEQFFTHMPGESGMAFVVVQHQDPEQASLLPEILRRYTDMPVVEIGDGGAKAMPNTVYARPSNSDIVIMQGNLMLIKPAHGAGAIDIFFRRLAEDQDGKAVGIILSGMGNDGTLGIRALKGHMGMTMAQEPSSAKFDLMPQNAIATGLVDYTAPPEDLPTLLIDYFTARFQLPHLPATQTSVSEGALARINALIRFRTGLDFSQYKRSTIMRRIDRRMSLHKLTKIDDYVRYLQENPHEVEIISKEMLIGVTQFFRDPASWERLGEALTGQIRSASVDTVLRIWVVGCSTGEEAYSMAIILQEIIESLGKKEMLQFQIFATDVNNEAIDVARIGKYPKNIEIDVSQERLERFFTRENESYQINPQLRDTVIFAQHNIIRDPPFTRLDVLSCRNLLIYLSAESQLRLIPLFHYALSPGGILFLGIAESIGRYNDLFRTVNDKFKIFQRKDVPTRVSLAEMPAVFIGPSSAYMARAPLSATDKVPSIEVIAREQLLERFAPAAIIVTESGDIVYFHGRTGNYLEPSPGKANLNVLIMARGGLRYSIFSALRKASSEKHEVAIEETLTIDGAPNKVYLTVQPLPKRIGMANLFMVTFEKIPEQLSQARSVESAKPGKNSSPPEARIVELEGELAAARAQLQQMAEEMQASREDLTSVNEEYQSANEELQSTNEELTTSKEELQSTNEEMLTVNAELKSKIEALTENQDDMRNLLQSTRIPILFLDKDLRVRRFTEEAKQIIRLIENDFGRPITDLKVNLKDESFAKDLRDVLETLQLKEKQVETTDGKWLQMRALPYRTSMNRIDGVVVTFSDITAIKQSELTLQDARNFSENIIATVLEPLVVLDADLKVVLPIDRSIRPSIQPRRIQIKDSSIP